MKELLIEGYSVEEILALLDDQIEAFVFAAEPFVFKAGSAEILGKFNLSADKLIVEFAQIDGGGEGVLLKLWTLVLRYASFAFADRMDCSRGALRSAESQASAYFEVAQFRDWGGVGFWYKLLQA